jgi:hypothetical protein
VELFQQQANWRNADLPTLHAWVLTKNYREQSRRIIAERNPFYWKIDPAGNQLPYLDQLIYTQGDLKEIGTMALNCEIEMQDYAFSSAPENRAGYEAKFRRCTGTPINSPPGLTSKSPCKGMTPGRVYLQRTKPLSSALLRKH